MQVHVDMVGRDEKGKDSADLGHVEFVLERGVDAFLVAEGKTVTRN